MKRESPTGRLPTSPEMAQLLLDKFHKECQDAQAYIQRSTTVSHTSQSAAPEATKALMIRVFKHKVEACLRNANDVYGKGEIVHVQWHPDNHYGMVVRQLQLCMDAQPFRVIDDGKAIRYLSRIRVIV